METFYEVTVVTAKFVKEHGDLIHWTTSGLAACAALVILLLHRTLPKQRWAMFFGWAFAVFAIQYAIYIVQNHLQPSPIDGEAAAKGVNTIFLWLVAFCSISNNLLFLAAARDLRDKVPALPKWAWDLALVSLLSILDVWWARLPDAIFSAYCFGELSYALSVNLSFRPRFFAMITLTAGFCYALVHVKYGLNPLLANANIADLASYQDKLQFLDQLDKAVVLPLKFSFFLSALILLLRSLVIFTASDIEKMSKQIVDGRSEYLTSEGIVKSMGETVRADAVELLVKLPGIQNNLMALFKWPEGVNPQSEPQIAPLPSGMESIEGWILLERAGAFPPKSGGEYFIHRDSYSSIKHIVSVDNNMLIVGVPVRYHGAVIACLKIKWKIVGLLGVERLLRKMNPSPSLRTTVISYVKRLADMIAPGVQSFREVAALNSFGSKFARLQVRKSATDIEGSVETITEYLHDVLSPLTTHVQIEMGFRAFSKVQGEAPNAKEGLNKNYAGQRSLLSSSLFVKIRQDEADNDFPIGQLVLAVPSGRDEIGRPTLATNERYRRAVASLVSDAVLDSARDHLSSILNDLGVRLNSENTLNIGGWFQWVEKAAKDAGLLWAVTKQLGISPLLGSPIGISVIDGLRQSSQQNGDAPYRYWPIDPPIEQLHGVIEIRLPDTGAQVWFGVARAGFGIELDFPSPWRVFIEHFAEIADAALVRLTAAVEMENLLTEAAKYQGLATVAVTTGTIIHQVVNLIKDLTGPTDMLLEAYNNDDLKCDSYTGRLIEVMSESAHRLLELTSNITNVTKLNESRPCSLHDATLESTKLYDTSINRYGIKLINKVSSDIAIDIFFYVAALAIANLISNAKDAIAKSGKGSQIVIEAEDVGDMVRCCITDDGPGIPDEIKDRVFDIGVTTKPDSGGWGLYLVARSLKENRGCIELSETGPSGTKFTICFPKERKV